MKRGIAIAVFITLLALVIPAVFAQMVELTGRSILNTNDLITGQATSPASTNVSLSLVGAPDLTLFEPENFTYIQNTSIPLKFFADDYLYLAYSLDGGAYVPVSSNTTFSTSSGGHSLRLYANNSYGERNRTIFFGVRVVNFTYSKYNGTNKGNSTDFANHSYEQLENISGVILENTLYGKIMFNGSINLTYGANISSDALDFDQFTNISYNRAFVDGAALPSLNIPATIYLYNLTFTNPRIRRDNAVCSAPHCTIVSYINGTIIFTVEGFSAYSAEATPVPFEEHGGGNPAGGSGGGAPAPAPLFCQPNWVCGDWSACANWAETRTCTDANSCATISGKPVEQRSCIGALPLGAPSPAEYGLIIFSLVIAIVIITVVILLATSRGKKTKFSRSLSSSITSAYYYLDRGNVSRAIADYRHMRENFAANKHRMSVDDARKAHREGIRLYGEIVKAAHK